jgi:hypothetical protein
VYEQIAANKRKTILLLFVSFLLLAAVGYAIGLIYGTGWVGLAIAVAIALLLQIGAYFSGDKLVLASARARAVTAEDEPRLHNIVEGLAIAAGVPKPAIYVVPEQAPNAFATGRDPDHSSVAVTQGLLETMDRVELEGVIGHEMAHVVDRDILYGTIVATVIGAIVLISEFFLRTWWWGGVGGGGGRTPERSRQRERGRPGADPVRDRVRVPHPRAHLRAADPVGRIPEPRVPGRRAGSHADAVPPGTDQRAQEDRGGPARDAIGEQCDGAPVVRSALTHPGTAERADGAAVLDAPADRRADPTPRGDVTIRS